jgi:hypothetical protein
MSSKGAKVVTATMRARAPDTKGTSGGYGKSSRVICFFNASYALKYLLNKCELPFIYFILFYFIYFILCILFHFIFFSFHFILLFHLIFYFIMLLLLLPVVLFYYFPLLNIHCGIWNSHNKTGSETSPKCEDAFVTHDFYKCILLCYEPHSLFSSFLLP